nr:hypothetical protein [Tanacetum cinerariifolium]
MYRTGRKIQASRSEEDTTIDSSSTRKTRCFPISLQYLAEFKMLAFKYVTGKMAEFMKEMLGKDVPNLMKLQILRREFELRSREKNLFIEKLKGNMDY